MHSLQAKSEICGKSKKVKEISEKVRIYANKAGNYIEFFSQLSLFIVIAR